MPLDYLGRHVEGCPADRACQLMFRILKVLRKSEVSNPDFEGYPGEVEFGEIFLAACFQVPTASPSLEINV